MKKIKETLLDKAGWLVKLIRKHSKGINTLHKFSKIVVFIALLYTSIVMYKLGNLLIGFIIMSIALFYLILNKMDSMM